MNNLETNKIVKSVPMEQPMIEEIHRIMGEELRKGNKTSFGETSRQLIQKGLDTIKQPKENAGV